MQLYGSTGGSENGIDLGQSQAGSLKNYEMAMRQVTAPPAEGSVANFTPGQGGVPYWYNNQPAAPAKYAVPTAMKERMQARRAIREAAEYGGASDKVPRPDPIRDEEVDYLQAMQRQAELADFDRYVNTLFDPKNPGNMKWLMQEYPEFVERRVQQIHDDYNFAVRNQMIDQFGINTFDDLHFKYLVDQQKISGPSLSKRTDRGLQYKAGALAPFKALKQSDGNVNLPYASSLVGIAPQATMSGSGQPLGEGRGLQEMARAVMSSDSQAPDGSRLGENTSNVSLLR